MFDEFIKSELEELAKLFPEDKPLFAVGGCVRDALRGEKCYDIDLSGAVKPDELINLLDGTRFKATGASPRLGTVIIKGNKCYEYTTFRIDSYPTGSGVHTPTQVEFTTDIVVDAMRRDFKCNAIYCRIIDNELIDPLDGIADVKRKVLSTTADSQTVLSQDGLRILRLARFVSTLGFEVDGETYESAKKLACRLEEISVERIRDELDKILAGDNCYKALHLLQDIGALKIILPELAANDGVAQKREYHRYDVLEHTFKVVEACPPNVRLAGLLHDVAKGVCMANEGNTYFHNVRGEMMAREILTRLKYPNRIIDRVARIVGLHMFDVNGNARECKCRRFIAQNIDLLDDLLDLFKADCIGTGYLQSSRTADKLTAIYAKMIEENVPMSIKALDVDGGDMQKLGYIGKEIGVVLNEIWDLALLGKIRNDKENLICVAKRMKKRVKKITHGE